MIFYVNYIMCWTLTFHYVNYIMCNKFNFNILWDDGTITLFIRRLDIITLIPCHLKLNYSSALCFQFIDFIIIFHYLFLIWSYFHAYLIMEFIIDKSVCLYIKFTDLLFCYWFKDGNSSQVSLTNLRRTYVNNSQNICRILRSTKS